MATSATIAANEIGETLRKIKTVQQQVAAIDPKSMDPMHALDHPVLTTRIKREVYWIETGGTGSRTRFSTRTRSPRASSTW